MNICVIGHDNDDMTQRSHATPRTITAHEFRVHEQLDFAARCIAISVVVFSFISLCAYHMCMLPVVCFQILVVTTVSTPPP